MTARAINAQQPPPRELQQLVLLQQLFLLIFLFGFIFVFLSFLLRKGEKEGAKREGSKMQYICSIYYALWLLLDSSSPILILQASMYFVCKLVHKS